jgi:hypothetical protein
MEDLIVRCSQLSKLMTKGRGSSALGETTKSYVKQVAKENFYGIRPQLSGKYLDKGNMNEDHAIEMINQLRFKNYQKNTVRKNNGWLSGECDVLDQANNHIIDTKCSWSFDTFPCFVDDAEKSVKKSGYDWQQRGYMMLWDCDSAEIAYCLTTTPEELLSLYDDPKIHKVDHIDLELRMTFVHLTRDKSLEEEIKAQYDIANTYYKECLLELKTKNTVEQWS